MFEKFVSTLNGIVWSPVLVVLLVGAGLYLSYRTGFVQVRRFGLPPGAGKTSRSGVSASCCWPPPCSAP